MSGGWSGGVFSLSVDMSANDAAGIPIVSSAFSNQSDEIKDGINACLTKDGSNSPSADLPMATKKHSNVGAAVGITNYVRAHEYITQNPIFMSDQDTGSTISVSCSATYWPASAVDGMVARIKMGATKPVTSAAEIEIVINGVTLSATMANGDPIIPGVLVSAQVHDFIYYGGKFRLQNPAVSVKKYAVVWKCRGTAGASVTCVSGQTATVLAAINGDIVNMWLDSKAGAAMTFGSSTGKNLVWSATPSHLLTDATCIASNLFIGTSALTTPTDNNPSRMVVGTSDIKIRPNNDGNLDTGILLYPFSVSYPRKRSL